MSQKPAMSDSKGQFNCRGGNRPAALPCLGGGVLKNMEGLHEDASGADGHTTHLHLDYGHTNLYRGQNVIEAHTGKSMGEEAG